MHEFQQYSYVKDKNHKITISYLANLTQNKIFRQACFFTDKTDNWVCSLANNIKRPL